MNTPEPTVALVGSGPAACYTAQMLRKQWKDAQIVLIDRLPLPYGLVRYGVAPDHQGTKAVTAQFARLFERENVRFLGNIDIGKDLSLESLRATFDVVVLASGLALDRRLGIAGDNLPQVYAAGRLTRHVNAHPDEADFTAQFGGRCLIVGNGNVALDVLRLLIKEDWQGSDLHSSVQEKLLRMPPRQIFVVGRSPAENAKFDAPLLRELGRIAAVSFSVPEGLPPSMDAKVQALRELCALSTDAPRCSVQFYFGWQPQAIVGSSKVEGMRFARADGRALSLETDSVISAIGFTQDKGSALCPAALLGRGGDLERGLLDSGLFCVGWLRRGARGTIPENRSDAKRVSEAIIAEVENGRIACHKAGLAALPAERLARCTDYSGWQRIDAAERQAAPAGRVRQKLASREELLAAADFSNSLEMREQQ